MDSQIFECLILSFPSGKNYEVFPAESSLWLFGWTISKICVVRAPSPPKTVQTKLSPGLSEEGSGRNGGAMGGPEPSGGEGRRRRRAQGAAAGR